MPHRLIKLRATPLDYNTIQAAVHLHGRPIPGIESQAYDEWLAKQVAAICQSYLDSLRPASGKEGKA
jgi:hypothetical protein